MVKLAATSFYVSDRLTDMKADDQVSSPRLLRSHKRKVEKENVSIAYTDSMVMSDFDAASLKRLKLDNVPADESGVCETLLAISPSASESEAGSSATNDQRKALLSLQDNGEPRQPTSTPSAPNEGIIYNVLETFNINKKTRYLVQTNEGRVYYGDVLRGTTLYRHVIHQSKAFLESKVRHLEWYAPIEVDADSFWPQYKPGAMKLFEGDINDELVYPKKQIMLKYLLFNRKGDAKTHRMLVEQEIRRNEEIERWGTDPSLAKYLGVYVDKFNLVKAVLYKRYSIDLWDFTHYPTSTRRLMRHHVPVIMTAVERAVRHLHNLGIVHCDIRPVNIFLVISRGNKNDNSKGKGKKQENRVKIAFDEIVLGDFDAAVQIADIDYMKTHGEGWWPEGYDRKTPATYEIDVYALEQLEKWLIREASGTSKGDFQDLF